MRSPAIQMLADAIAAALLAGRWAERPMIDRTTRAIADPARQRWARPLVRRVLTEFPEAPIDAPRALAAFVAADDWHNTTVGLTVRRWTVSPVRMRPGSPGTRHWRVPVLDAVADLAGLLRLSTDELDWFAGLTHPPRGGTSSHYRYRWLAKASGGHRLLEIPLPRLAAVQRHVLRAILEPIPPHDAAHGFRRGRSAATHAALHAHRQTVLRLDLESFFATVTAGRVYGLFRTVGYAEPVAHVLTGLLTTVTQRSARLSAPREGSSAARPDDRARLDAALRTPHVPQGAPSSPALASLCLYRLDRRLTGLAAALPGEVRYSRYADDLVFSGDDGGLLRAGQLVAAIVADSGLRVAPAKTRAIPRSARQTVTGLVVNDHVAVRRPEIDRIRAIVHDARIHGPAAANLADRPEFRDHLLGLVSWVAATGTPRALAIAAEARLIVWQ
jgi:RNA-directed DNA polymerase